MNITLERPVATTQPLRLPLLANLGPNWFASVMGTGIVATSAATLPHRPAGLHTFALVVWVLAAVLLVMLTVATAVHWALHPAQARAHLQDRVVGHFYGAPAMALLTVGAGTLLLGGDLIGLRTALGVDWALWIAGTAGGLVCAVLVPYTTFIRRDNPPGAAFGGWLMPVVPPMVSATTGALLITHMAPGQARATMVALCYSMFGFSLLASLIVIALVWERLAQHGVGAAAAVPTLWIVLGPMGQSIAAAIGLGNAALVPGARAFGLLYGLMAWGFAVVWLVVVTAITVKMRPPLTLAWWSFVFPLGTVVLGTSALAARTGLDMFSWAAVVLYAALVTVWATVLVRTARNARTLLR